MAERLQGDTATIRVGGTRVTLATVVHTYQGGASAEEIALGLMLSFLADENFNGRIVGGDDKADGDGELIGRIGGWHVAGTFDRY